MRRREGESCDKGVAWRAPQPAYFLEWKYLEGCGSGGTSERYFHHSRPGGAGGTLS